MVLKEDILGPETPGLLDIVLMLGIAAVVICVGMRCKRVFARERSKDESPHMAADPELEMAQDYTNQDSTRKFEKAGSGVDPRRASAKGSSRTVRDRAPRRARAARFHQRLEDESDEIYDSPSSSSVTNSRHTSPARSSDLGSKRRTTRRKTVLPPRDHAEGQGETQEAPPPKNSEPRTTLQAPTHYDVLGISRDASDADVKRAFFRLSKIYHPDKNVGKEAEAEQIFIQVREAYEILSDVNLRKEYDIEIG